MTITQHDIESAAKEFASAMLEVKQAEEMEDGARRERIKARQRLSMAFQTMRNMREDSSFV